MHLCWSKITVKKANTSVMDVHLSVLSHFMRSVSDLGMVLSILISWRQSDITLPCFIFYKERGKTLHHVLLCGAKQNMHFERLVKVVCQRVNKLTHGWCI